jgi:hypothetical protein
MLNSIKEHLQEAQLKIVFLETLRQPKLHFKILDLVMEEPVRERQFKGTLKNKGLQQLKELETRKSSSI